MKSTTLICATVILWASGAVAQQGQSGNPPSPKTAPTLTATEQAAIDHLRQTIQETQKLFSQIDLEYRKAHPGFHLSGITIQPEQDVPQPKPADKK